MLKTKILLIEDDESFASSIKLMLREHPIEIVWAPDAKTGIQAFKAGIHKFATVVIDYLLPDMKGSDVCIHLRRQNPEQEFLFTSGHQNPEFLTDILATGSAGFLYKGRSIDEMAGHSDMETTNEYVRKAGIELKGATDKLGYVVPTDSVAKVLELAR